MVSALRANPPRPTTVVVPLRDDSRPPEQIKRLIIELAVTGALTIPMDQCGRALQSPAQDGYTRACRGELIHPHQGPDTHGSNWFPGSTPVYPLSGAVRISTR